MPSKAPVFWGGDLEVATLQLFHPETGAALAADDRKALLERVRAGEAMELQFTARTFVQRETPNRNFLRVAPKVITKLGRSFKGTPFLRDHDKHSVLARGGTVTESSVEHAGDGSVSFIQTIKLTKAWAIEGVLDGTIDRFSIGFIPTGPILCSVHKAQVFRSCSCWPGDKVGKESDGCVEFVYTAAEGVEVSAVNVPAVTGTGVDDIRAALAAIDDSQQLGPERPKEKRMDWSAVLKKLGLSEAASPEHALAALEKREVESEATASRLKLTEGKLAEFELERARDQTRKLEADIEQLYMTGRLPMKRDAAGKRVPHELESHLRRMFDALGYDGFKAYADEMPATFGPGKPQSTPTALHTTPGPDTQRPIEQAALRLNLDPSLMRETLEQMGLTDEQVAKFGPRQGV